VYGDVAYAPFGEPYDAYGTADLSFTGQNQDTVNGIYDFLFRESSPIQGRWISPDPAGLAAADLTNPQSLNRYAYVLNSPSNVTDPDGLCDAVIAGVNMSPNSPNSAQLNAFAQDIGAETAFPYSESGVIAGALHVVGQAFGPNEATQTAAAALSAAANDSSGPIDVFTFSGGAEAFNAAVKLLPSSITSRIRNVVYLSPGHIGDLYVSSNGNTSTIMNPAGAIDPIISWNSFEGIPPGLRYTDCAHKANCEFPEQRDFLKTQAGSRCVNKTSPFTPNGGSDRPNGGDTGGPYWGIGNGFDWLYLWAEGVPVVTTKWHMVK
jgi:RHS repeat-associated protein